jgi:hypothetical protein
VRNLLGFAAAAAVAIAVATGVAIVAVSGGGAARRVAPSLEHGLGARPKEAIYEQRGPDRGLEASSAAGEQVDNRAYPRGYVESRRALAARRAFVTQPARLGASDFRAGTPQAAARATLHSTWQELGPFTPTVPAEVTYAGPATLSSGRVTAMAVDPNCGRAGAGCRLWVAAAGGGIWRTADALAPAPSWAPASTGLASFATGSLLVDPNDPSGNTLYLGTGEPNGSTDSEAGVGLYRTTDGGDHWTLVPGTPAVAHDRSIGAIAVDPTDPNHLYIGTDVARHGHSATYGGRRTPPGAPALGLYESRDGGATFTLAFSRPASPVDPGAGIGNDYFQGGVNRLELDPADPGTVYAAVFGYGIWRRSAKLDGDTAFHQVFVTRNPADSYGDRTEFALARLADGRTRLYAGDSSDDDAVSELWRTDAADQPASQLASATANSAPWQRLSSGTAGTPGFTSFNYCQSQCGYDDVVAVDPRDPNTVWLGGQMAYGEIPGAAGGTERSFGRAVVRSTDAGVTFTDMTQDRADEGLHPDTHAILPAPVTPGAAFIGSDGGVARIGGAHVDRSAECAGRKLDAPELATCRMLLASTPVQIDAINDGLNTLQFQDITFNPNNPLGDLAGGTQDNGTWAGPGSWLETIGGDGGPSAIGLDGVHHHSYHHTTGGVNFHGNDPRTWDYTTYAMDNSGESSAFYAPLIADPAVPASLFTGMQHVWRTQDNGGDQAQLDANCRDLDPLGSLPPSSACGDWRRIGPDLTDTALGDRAGQFVSRLARAPSDRGTLWAATRTGRLFVSVNADAADPAAVAFDRIDTPATPGRFPSGIAVDPADADHAWVSYSGYDAYTPGTPGHVFEVRFNRATHAAAFTDRSLDLGDQPITDVAFDPPTGDLYAGTDFGVVRLPAGATAWEKAAEGLPPVSVYGLAAATGARVLYAATHGRGIYALPLPGAPQAVIDAVGTGSGPPDGSAGGRAGSAGGVAPGARTRARLRLDRLGAVLRGAARPYVRVRFRLTGPARVVIRVRDEHGAVVASRTITARRAGTLTVRLTLRRGVRISHRRHWRVGVRATGATREVAPATRRFQV